MKTLHRSLSIFCATASLVGCTSLIPAHALETAPDPTTSHHNPQVIGGTRAHNPWVVQLKFQNQGSTGTFACTGEQINAEWVLTAKHCVDEAASMNIYQSNDQLNPGNPISADRVHLAPSGDIALVHLSRPAPLPAYAQLDLNYRITPGDRATIMGYGLGAHRQPTTTLRAASVLINGSSTDAYYGRAIHINGITGAANKGDSGGPLIVRGKVVGVCSTGDQANPGANIKAGSNYSLLAPVGDWITKTAGLTPSTPYTSSLN